MKILISGASGLVGSELVQQLKKRGETVGRLVRSNKSPAPGDRVVWDPETGNVLSGSLSGYDAVVHLAGESIAGGRWTESKKRRIRASRIQGTRALVQQLSQSAVRPRVFICASAVGFYGDRGGARLTESAEPGTGFLPEVCIEWERATDPLRTLGIRVVNLRFGVILSPEGGALKVMLPAFWLGVAGRIGTGTQYMSWVSCPDAVRIIERVIDDARLEGPINAVAPEPVTNNEFTKALGRVLSRPTIVPMPAFAARLVFGEMADALLLASERVVPEKLTSGGFVFHHPTIVTALKGVLGR